MRTGLRATDRIQAPRMPMKFDVWAGPFAASGLAVLLLITRNLGFPIPNPNLIFALILVVAAYMGGLTSGLVTALIALLFTAFDWAIPGHLLAYSQENMRRLIVAVLCMPSMAVVVGFLKAKAESQRKTISRYLDLEKERNQQLALALKQTDHPEGALPICAWCHKTREEDGHWTSLEDHLSLHYGTVLTHGICPDCRPAFHSGGSIPLTLLKALPNPGASDQPSVGPSQKGGD